MSALYEMSWLLMGLGEIANLTRDSGIARRCSRQSTRFRSSTTSLRSFMCTSVSMKRRPTVSADQRSRLSGGRSAARLQAPVADREAILAIFNNDFAVAPVYLREVGRMQGLLAVYFFVHILQTLLKCELRRDIAAKGLESLPLYPEKGGPAHVRPHTASLR